MEVIIDGIRYTPENQNFTMVRGVDYNNVAHWLYNIHTEMVHEWANMAKDDRQVNATPEAVALWERIKEFEDYTEKFLGFKYVHENGCYKFVECPTFDPVAKLDTEKKNPSNS